MCQQAMQLRCGAPFHGTRDLEQHIPRCISCERSAHTGNVLGDETQKLTAHELERGERRTGLRFGKLEER